MKDEKKKIKLLDKRIDMNLGLTVYDAFNSLLKLSPDDIILLIKMFDTHVADVGFTSELAKFAMTELTDIIEEEKDSYVDGFYDGVVDTELHQMVLKLSETIKSIPHEN